MYIILVIINSILVLLANSWACFYSNKICVLGWERKKLSLNKKSLILFTLKFKIIYMIKIAFCLNFYDNLYKDIRRQEIGEKLQSFHLNDLKKS